jgi:hypothetical protein
MDDPYTTFDPDNYPGYGDYYDPYADPRGPTTINKQGGRVNYTAAGNRKHPSVPVGHAHIGRDVTDDYDYQYQDGTNFRHSTRCAPVHRGVKDTRTPPLRYAGGMSDSMERMTGDLSGLQVAPSQLEMIFMFFLAIIVFFHCLQLRELYKQTAMIKKLRGDGDHTSFFAN